MGHSGTRYTLLLFGEHLISPPPYAHHVEALALEDDLLDRLRPILASELRITNSPGNACAIQYFKLTLCWSIAEAAKSRGFGITQLRLGEAFRSNNINPRRHP